MRALAVAHGIPAAVAPPAWARAAHRRRPRLRQAHDRRTGPPPTAVTRDRGRARRGSSVDLDAIRANVAALRAPGRSGAQVMAVVKADAYGHGLVPSARAALAGGATWLGVAQLAEALALRAAGVDRAAALLALRAGRRLRAGPSTPTSTCRRRQRLGARRDRRRGPRASAAPARVHLKVDTGLGRGGAFAPTGPTSCGRARPREAEGAVEVVGVWSHFAYADAPQHPTVRAQQERFVEAVADAERAGVRPEVRHLANSAATLTNPSAHFDLVRPGHRRLRPLPGADLGDPTTSACARR